MAGLAELTFDSQLYGVDAIQKAAYRSMHAFTLDLKVEGGNMLCKLIGNITTEQDAFERAVEEFRKDVLDYQLRAQLHAETAPIRNLIMGLAFSNARLN
ncbi:TPA: His-Xaa-Ser system protein HxsD [Pseudomonas aeruginosa]|uniref:His-Xaa-Ser system protein HxsD n=1 Tax=Pseudomonas TaxID=286 RepID=UPI00053D3656|nr:MULTISPECIES: His-Xaa-Ser system protein HxsD [Pseudomonas]ELM7149196.1 His-Xaa-Ser system protein HxsD [Pseudomonas aeruginosa]MDI4072230.1 His-Xaa-Ser system protein HxsD [Pseudomonas aeruginosa]MED5025369.1 His-Xaa-Ser system protein HxsD [Pseudomonas aeruginosa]NPS66440.1 His-Xaa-Ser system protein HxsD [Pseudomonas aeruginosa]HEJ1394145.1 His-Xaa-Ser system protein HxsD [Pseudomonas aeruginosa]